MIPSASPIRVLVVDDSAVVRHIVARALSEDPAIEVVGTAANGQIALDKVKRLRPDLVTLDIEMPEMGGLEALEHLQRQHPLLPVIMFSSLTEFGAVATLQALALGAKDYVTKPTGVRGVGEAAQQIRDLLARKIKALVRRETTQKPSAPFISGENTPPPALEAREIGALVIGVSTGGPKALADVLPALPADLPVPVLVVQHMPAMFTRFLAESLDQKCALAVREGADGAVVEPGTIWLAPGDYHMRVVGDTTAPRLQISQDAPQNYCRPAVDALFRSAVDVYKDRVLAAVLTGMGRDGLEGARTIRAAGGTVLAQDEATSVVWGMPRAVVEAGVAAHTLPLSGMAPAITEAIMNHGVLVR